MTPSQVLRAAVIAWMGPFAAVLALAQAPPAATLEGPSAGEAQSPSGRYALLVGIGSYESAQLERISSARYRANDANALGRLLADRGYLTVVLTDGYATRQRLLRELERLVATVSPGDSVLILLGAEAVRKPANDTTYLLTYDARLDFLDDAAFRVEHLIDYVSDIPSERIMLLLDTCFAGDVVTAFASSEGGRVGRVVSGVDLRPRGSAPLPDLRSLESARGRGLFIIAGSGGFESSETEHSSFVQAFLEAATTSRADADRDGRLSTFEAARFLTTRVAELNAGFGRTGDVATLQMGAQSWPLLDLPTMETERKTLARRYGDMLQEWRSQGWISAVTFIKVRSVMETWETGGELSPEEAALWERSQEYLKLESSSLQDRVIALAFEVDVKGLME